MVSCLSTGIYCIEVVSLKPYMQLEQLIIGGGHGVLFIHRDLLY